MRLRIHKRGGVLGEGEIRRGWSGRSEHNPPAGSEVAARTKSTPRGRIVLPVRRSLHSSTFRLSVSTFWRLRSVLAGCQCLKPTQAGMKRGRL